MRMIQPSVIMLLLGRDLVMDPCKMLGFPPLLLGDAELDGLAGEVPRPCRGLKTFQFDHDEMAGASLLCIGVELSDVMSNLLKVHPSRIGDERFELQLHDGLRVTANHKVRSPRSDTHFVVNCNGSSMPSPRQYLAASVKHTPSKAPS